MSKGWALVRPCGCGRRWTAYRPRLSFVRGGPTFQPVACRPCGIVGVVPWAGKRSGGAAFRARGRRIGP